MENFQKIIKIDGSFGSGGGQILRTAVALAAIFQKPCHIFNIRKKRKNPGLRTQHLLGLRSLAQFSQGRLEKDEIGSKEILFYPGSLENPLPFLKIKIPTAGSITLILQTLLLPALFQKNSLKIHFQGGATDTFFAPTLDHFRFVFLGILRKILPPQREIKIQIKKRGYWPEGGAELELEISPLSFQKSFLPLNLTEQGKLKKILIFSGASKFLRKKRVAERQIFGAREILAKLKFPLEEHCEYFESFSFGSHICLIFEFENTILGIDNLGKLGKRAEKIGKEAAIEILKEAKTKAPLDRYLADQILPYLALAQGKSKIKVSQITSHCKTNIWVIEKFVKGKFEIKDKTITWNPEN